MINDLQLDEYKRRSNKFSIDLHSLDLLTKMNHILEKSSDISDGRFEHPFIFSFGLPRSGTTFLSQLIASGFDVGYIDNIIARFWLAPEYGIELSKILKGSNYKSNYLSEYAHTDIFEPHEFAYFWQKWLKKEKLEDYLIVGNTNNFDEIGFKNIMLQIAFSFNKPVSFKNIIGANHIDYLDRILGNVIWIYIKRKPLDVIISILESREKYYGDINQWWSTYPVEYYDIKDLEGYEQVVAQVFYLKELYEKNLVRNRKNCLIIDYKELTNDPITCLDSIKERLFEIYNYKIETTFNRVPESFMFREKNIEKYDIDKISSYYKKYFKRDIYEE